ncbi:T6SS immunity protein Tli4 family protein [Massilia sp. GER05]|uniref:T6SS immunity protein Tli4 family protein n=1 Tax=Massilia sp. GER05 TaxID=3394605 RepID=UPI003F841D1E
MKIGKRTRYTFIVVAGLFVAVLVASKTPPQHQQSRTAQQMMQQTKTVCVGRLMVDLPADAEVTFTDARVDGVTISVEAGYDAQKAAAAIAERVSALGGETNELGRPSLEKSEVVDGVNLQATLLYSGREKAVTRMRNGQPVTGDEGITVEAFALKDDLLYRFKGQSLASPKYEQVVHDLVKNFASRTAGSMPAEPGFCTENGIIHSTTPPEPDESVTMFATLKGHPDIAIRLDTAVLDKPQESLLARHAKNDTAMEFASSIKYLGKQARTLNGIPGSEVLVRVKESNGTSAHSFMWESPGKGMDVLAPNITLELETGKGNPGNPVNSSLSDEAALQLWQAISTSLRLRPTSTVNKVGNTAHVPAVPLGELVATGKVCPQTGYWQCSEHATVEGAQPQFFRQGDLMPPATLRGAPSLWQKLSGNVRTHEVATVWTLIAYQMNPDGKPTDDNRAQQRPKASGPDDSLT